MGLIGVPPVGVEGAAGAAPEGAAPEDAAPGDEGAPLLEMPLVSYAPGVVGTAPVDDLAGSCAVGDGGISVAGLSAAAVGLYAPSVYLHFQISWQQMWPPWLISFTCSHVQIQGRPFHVSLYCLRQTLSRISVSSL